MKLRLVRYACEEYGILGMIFNEKLSLQWFTLEHAFASADGRYYPALPTGRYQCEYGVHTLEHLSEPFFTWEVKNVPGHTGILFHIGNRNSDSEGCILLGKAYNPNERMIEFSKTAFDDFIAFTTAVREPLQLDVWAV